MIINITILHQIHFLLKSNNQHLTKEIIHKQF